MKKVTHKNASMADLESVSVGAKTELPLRFVVFHLHPTSARLRFLLFENNLFGPQALPVLSDLLDHAPLQADIAALHPSSYLRSLCERFQIDQASLSIEKEFRSWIDTPKRTLPIFLARVVIDQPFTAPRCCRWMELPECHWMTSTEKLMMQRIYEWLLG